MPPKKRNQTSDKTQILQIDSTKFQVVVIIVVEPVMAHLNTSNVKVSGNVIDNRNHGDNPVQQQVPVCKDTPDL